LYAQKKQDYQIEEPEIFVRQDIVDDEFHKIRRRKSQQRNNHHTGAGNEIARHPW